MLVEGGGDLVGCVSAVPSNLDSNDYYDVDSTSESKHCSGRGKICMPPRDVMRGQLKFRNLRTHVEHRDFFERIVRLDTLRADLVFVLLQRRICFLSNSAKRLLR